MNPSFECTLTLDDLKMLADLACLADFKRAKSDADKQLVLGTHALVQRILGPHEHLIYAVDDRKAA